MKLKKNKLEDRSKGKHFLHNFYILLIFNEDTQLFYVLRFRPLCFFTSLIFNVFLSFSEVSNVHDFVLVCQIGVVSFKWNVVVQRYVTFRMK